MMIPNRTMLPILETATGMLPEKSITLLTPNTATIASSIPTSPSPAIIPEQNRIPSLTAGSFSLFF